MSASHQAAESCLESLSLGTGETPDVAIVFFSPHHLTAVAQVSMAVMRRLRCRRMIGISTEGVMGGSHLIERAPALGILALRCPGVTVTPFATEQFPVADGSAESLFALRDVVGISEDLAATFLLADPFSTSMVKMLPDLNAARVGGRGVIFGGMASASMNAGGNALLLDDRILKYGAVGVSLSGPIRVDAVVSQGCKAYGPAMVITKARNNLSLELGGKPAIEAIQDALSEVGSQRRSLVASGMYMGIAIDEQKPRFGRDDFLVRRIVGVRPEQGAVAVAELVRAGQTVRLHTRDAQTARDDLAMVLDAQKLHDPPAGILVAAAAGRGRRLFKDGPGDAQAITKAFSQAAAGTELSKGGTPYYSTPPALPLAGFVTTGEVAPIAGRSHVHHQTACVAIIRDVAD
jgi:small ligand-binding sensory domain FIST